MCFSAAFRLIGSACVFSVVWMMFMCGYMGSFYLGLGKRLSKHCVSELQTIIFSVSCLSQFLLAVRFGMGSWAAERTEGTGLERSEDRHKICQEQRSRRRTEWKPREGMTEKLSSKWGPCQGKHEPHSWTLGHLAWEWEHVFIALADGWKDSNKQI